MNRTEAAFSQMSKSSRVILSVRDWWVQCRSSPTFSVLLRVAVPIVALSLSMNRDLRWLAQRQHLAAEAYNVGQALADGRGFSDPFGEATGPTAWVSPLYPAILSLLIRLLGGRHEVSFAVMVLQVATLIIVAAVIYHLSGRYRARIAPMFAVVLYLSWIVAFHHWYFVLTSDIWLGMLLLSALLFEVADEFSNRRVRFRRWGLLGGLATLTNPALGAAWGCLIVWSYSVNKAHRRKSAIAAALVIVLVAPWIVRNAIVFRDFVPIKSNLAFEVQQANVIDDNGIYDPRSINQHPFNNSELRFEYARLGEKRFVAAAGARFWDHYRQFPGEVLHKVRNRALAVTVVLVPSGIGEPPWAIWLQRIIYPLPVVGLVTGLLLGRHQRRLFALLAAIFAAYLVPYVLVAFYLRYLFPLTPLLMLVAFLGIDQLVSRWRLPE